MKKGGQQFWKKIYASTQGKYQTTPIPINTFNKVWIVPEKSVVYENKGVTLILNTRLKVLLEESRN